MASGIDWSWAMGVGLITFAFGIAFGVGIAALIPAKRRREQELQEKLTQLQQEFDSYRDEVGKHFLTTSQLVQKMTESYRDVYEHLATGSEALCQNPVSTPRLDIPEHPTLESVSDSKAKQENMDSFPDAEADAQYESDSDDFLGDAPRVPTLDTHDDFETRSTPRTPSL